MQPVYLFDHPLFREHDTGPGHPECPERLDAIVDGMRRRALIERVEWVEPSPAGREDLLRVHAPAYVKRMLGLRGKQEWIDGDTLVSPASIDAALLACGACIEATERVLGKPGSAAFCLGRPPGHHAERNRAMGFCLFNQVAVAAARALADKRVERVLIFDPDVHHGNGTQDIFYERGDVCYVSVHQWPLFPGTGRIQETGEGEGAGRTVNLPLPPGMRDADYCFAVEQVVLPLIRSYAPGLVLFSAGFDAHEDDPLAGMRLTSAGFVAFYSLILRELAARKIPAVFCLEGGYSLKALSETVPALIEFLLDEKAPPPRSAGEPHAAVKEIVAEVLATHSE